VIALWAALFVAKGLCRMRRVRRPDLRFAAPMHGNISTQNISRPSRRPRSRPPARARCHAQEVLLRAEVARLVPQQKGSTDIYAIGVAGWSDLDVFVKEIDGAFEAIAQILPIRDRTIRLVNSPETVESDPHASRRNFAAAVHAVAQVMDRDEDVLLLVMSSHGTAAGFSLQLPGGTTQVLTPHESKRSSTRKASRTVS